MSLSITPACTNAVMQSINYWGPCGLNNGAISDPNELLNRLCTPGECNSAYIRWVNPVFENCASSAVGNLKLPTDFCMGFTGGNGSPATGGNGSPATGGNGSPATGGNGSPATS
ncbi:hypothetical protein HK099_004444, partial [Clydaea vesicula]